MYGIKPDADLSFLVGRELLQVCTGQAQAIQHFENSVSILIEADFEVCLNGITDRSTGFPLSGGLLLPLIGSRVQRARVASEVSLQLAFTDERILTLLDSNASTESFSIECPGGGIVV